MKGFIEVSSKVQGGGLRKIMINLQQVEVIYGSPISEAATIFTMNNSQLVDIEETYEEVKQLIKEAQGDSYPLLGGRYSEYLEEERLLKPKGISEQMNYDRD